MTTRISHSAKIAVTRDLKIKLLKSIQAGEIDTRDFPELQQAGRVAIESDLEGLSEAELDTIMEAIRILERLPSFHISP